MGRFVAPLNPIQAICERYPASYYWTSYPSERVKYLQKVPHTHRYHLSGSGRAILIAVLTTARTSVHQLNQLATAA